MKILLTGANGFIGSHLLKKLLLLGHELFIVTRPSSNLSRIQEELSSVTMYSYEDPEWMQTAFSNRIGIVIHLAGEYIKHDTSSDKVHKINAFNIETASQITYHAQHAHVSGFINTGTFFEYDLYQKQPMDENSPQHPYNYYAASKIAYSQILKYFTENSQMKGITLKLFSPYGPCDNEKIIPLIVTSALLGQNLTLKDNTQILSFTYIDDVIDAYLRAIDLIQISQKPYDDFLIGADKSYSIQEIIDNVQQIHGQKLRFSAPQTKLSQRIIIQCNTQKAEKVLGWKAHTNLKTGLRKTYEYYKKCI